MTTTTTTGGGGERKIRIMTSSPSAVSLLLCYYAVLLVLISDSATTRIITTSTSTAGVGVFGVGFVESFTLLSLSSKTTLSTRPGGRRRSNSNCIATPTIGSSSYSSLSSSVSLSLSTALSHGSYNNESIHWRKSSHQLWMTHSNDDADADDDATKEENGIEIERDSEKDTVEGEHTNVIAHKRQLTNDFVKIGLPALLQLAAEPLAGLVDTAYLGRLGPEVLGGAGVAISAQYAVSKLYNDPLLRTSISLVAATEGQSRSSSTSSTNTSSSHDASSDANHTVNNTKDEKLSIAVSSALLLALCVGVIQMIVYTVFATAITQGMMGLTPTNKMWYSAVSYLQVRALGTPAATLWLVTNGIFRGLGDTSTPLLYSLLFTTLNAILDPLFIFTFQFGASGAAAGTAIAQYVALVPLMLALHRKIPGGINLFGQLSKLKSSLQEYILAGSLVLVRTFGKVLAYSICARKAAALGAVSAAAYNLTFQLGFATTQICEAVAVAVQTLLARELSDTTTYSTQTKAKLIRHLINTSILFGGGVATVLSITTYLQQDSILRGLTTNPEIRNACTAIFPAVLVTQVMKGLAYPVNGIIMGGLDWVFSMTTMWIANFVCLGMIAYFGMMNGIGGIISLNQIWWSLAAFMATQVITGITRYESKTGVWNVLKNQKRVTATIE